MDKYPSINVNIDVNGKWIDLRIPRLVKRDKLKEVLIESLQVMGITLPQSFELEIVSKSFASNQVTMLSDYALGDADQIKIIEKENIGESKK